MRKPSAPNNHRTTLPQSALAGCQLPQRGSRGNVPTMSITRPLTKHQRAGDFWGFVWGCVLPFNRVLAKPGGWRAIFIAPTKLKNRFPLPFNGRHSLSLAFARQLPQGGSREGCVPFIGVLAKIPGWRAIFIAPTEGLKFWALAFGYIRIDWGGMK